MNAQEHRDTLPGPGSGFWKGNITAAVRYLLEREAARESTPPAPTGQDEVVVKVADVQAVMRSPWDSKASRAAERIRAALSTLAPPEPDSIAAGTRVRRTCPGSNVCSADSTGGGECPDDECFAEWSMAMSLRTYAAAAACGRSATGCEQDGEDYPGAFGTESRSTGVDHGAKCPARVEPVTPAPDGTGEPEVGAVVAGAVIDSLPDRYASDDEHRGWLRRLPSIITAALPSPAQPPPAVPDEETVESLAGLLEDRPTCEHEWAAARTNGEPVPFETWCRPCDARAVLAAGYRRTTP